MLLYHIIQTLVASSTLFSLLFQALSGDNRISELADSQHYLPVCGLGIDTYSQHDARDFLFCTSIHPSFSGTSVHAGEVYTVVYA